MERLNIAKCPNLYIKHEDYAEILLQNKKGEIIASALVDLGQYDTFEDAVKARLEAEIEYFGEYRGCNSKFSYLLED